jgi:hypothetical protein
MARTPGGVLDGKWIRGRTWLTEDDWQCQENVQLYAENRIEDAMCGSQTLSECSNVRWTYRHIFLGHRGRQFLAEKRWLEVCRILVLMECNLMKEKVRNVLAQAESSLESVSQELRTVYN